MERALLEYSISFGCTQPARRARHYYLCTAQCVYGAPGAARSSRAALDVACDSRGIDCSQSPAVGPAVRRPAPAPAGAERLRGGIRHLPACVRVGRFAPVGGKPRGDAVRTGLEPVD